jgi:hypothetical protein
MWFNVAWRCGAVRKNACNVVVECGGAVRWSFDEEVCGIG